MTRNWIAVGLLLLACSIAFPAGAATRYVSPGGSDANDGLTWATAVLSVNQGLAAAISGDQVWVAAGSYATHAAVPNGVGLYGGFAGGETALSQRNPALNVTTLDGGGFGNIIWVAPGSGQTVDGFTITHGQTGVAVYNSSAVVSNNRVVNNTNAWNSGISVEGGSPRILNNFVAGNTGFGDGGGMLFVFSSPVIEGNTITQNSGRYGGGINFYQCGAITVIGNTITANQATYIGAIIVNNNFTGAADFENNVITFNTALQGGTGGIQMAGVTSATVNGNTISNNIANVDVGGFLYGFSPITFTNNTVQANSGVWAGGVVIFDCAATISGNTISQNTASGYGIGGIEVSNIDGVVSSNVIRSNHGGFSGGMAHIGSRANVLNNTFANNVSDFVSGGLELESSVTVANNVFKGNQAVYGGGIGIGQGTSPRIINNTIVSNTATGAIGGVNAYFCSPFLANNIIAFNNNGGVSGTSASSTAMDSNCVFGNSSYNYGDGISSITGDINVDPAFNTLQSLHLKNTSPCIDAGDDTVIDPLWTDISNNPRIANKHVDIGAYEFQGKPK